jgi:hypothetical protein
MGPDYSGMPAPLFACAVVRRSRTISRGAPVRPGVFHFGVDRQLRAAARVHINAQLGGPLSRANRKTFARSELYWF